MLWEWLTYPITENNDLSNKLVTEKMKDETKGVAIVEYVRLKPKMCSFLLCNSDHNIEKAVNKNVVATISHNEYKDVCSAM